MHRVLWDPQKLGHPPVQGPLLGPGRLAGGAQHGYDGHRERDGQQCVGGSFGELQQAREWQHQVSILLQIQVLPNEAHGDYRRREQHWLLSISCHLFATRTLQQRQFTFQNAPEEAPGVHKCHYAFMIELQSIVHFIFWPFTSAPLLGVSLPCLFDLKTIIHERGVTCDIILHKFDKWWAPLWSFSFYFSALINTFPKDFTKHTLVPPFCEPPRTGRGIVYLLVTGEAFCLSLTNDLLCGYAGN